MLKKTLGYGRARMDWGVRASFLKERMKKKEILEKPCFVIVKTVKIRYYYKGVTTLHN